MAPVLAARVFPNWNTPIDRGFVFRGVRVFGDHKTVRGLLAGAVTGGLTFLLQLKILEQYPQIGGIAYPGFLMAPVWFGFWQGFCALLGDAVKSFFKRRRRIRPGGSWMPFDQIDWTIGVLLGSYAFIKISALHALTAIIIAFVFSLSAHTLGYLAGLNSDPT